jgi:hypothetical protein
MKVNLCSFNALQMKHEQTRDENEIGSDRTGQQLLMHIKLIMVFLNCIQLITIYIVLPVICL